MVVYRVQDSEGRGLGVQALVADGWRIDQTTRTCRRGCLRLDPYIAARQSGEHIGSACETLGQLQRWFTESEYRTLLGFGYRCVSIGGARILGRSNTQCVIACAKPLREIAATVDLYPQLQEAP